jgi:manganese/zinc/iron transport system substrate-binding protein
MIYHFLLISLSILLLLPGCTSKQEKKHRLTIVATTGIIADGLRAMLDSNVQIISLMGPGVDPHLYKAGAGDLDKLSSADIIVHNGLHLEGKMADVLQKMKANHTVIALSDGISQDKLRPFNQGTDAWDPHIWFDISLWRSALHYAAGKIAQRDSGGKELWKKSSQEYLLSLDSLHGWVQSTIATIPAERRILITAHDAFGYFGRAYNIQVIGLQGISTVSEYSVKDVLALSNLIIDRGVRAIFVESSVPRRSIEAVVENVKAQGGNVHIGGQLYSDALGNANTPEGTYIGMVSANVRVIAQSLR